MWINGNRRSDYSTLLLSGVLLLAISQALGGPQARLRHLRGALQLAYPSPAIS